MVYGKTILSHFPINGLIYKFLNRYYVQKLIIDMLEITLIW